jgi:methyl-accepting chemotaxis protein
VASEVRSLAQRASDSAKDIKALIDHATTSVAEGAALVMNTDEALSRFVLQVDEISSVIGRIAETAQDQATGLGEVNTAVMDLDRATQQNAAMVEQATAATQSLSREAVRLSEQLAFFTVGQPRTDALRRQAADMRQPAAAARPQPPRQVRKVASGGRPRTAGVGHGEDWTEF